MSYPYENNRDSALLPLMPASKSTHVSPLRTNTQLPELPDCNVITSIAEV
jgi:hypothetical protein